ncbi:MAG: DNA replication/repair protein RecF [Myxococcota bacterium]
MHLLALECENFRNLEPLRLDPHPRFNILEGNNGQGKTNLLEAIYLLGTLQSFRESKTRMLVRWDAESAWVRGEVERRGVVRKMGVELTPKGKRAAVDGKTVPRLTEYFGHLHVVIFGPEDLALTKGGPGERRRFLDRAIFNLYPAYLDDMRAYVRALRSRNRLLREAPDGALAPSVLESFDEELVRRGARVLDRRLRFLAGFRPVFEEAFRRITGGDHELGVRYDGARGVEEGLDEAALAGRLRERSQRTLQRDRRRGYTGSGPHVDDLVFTLDGHPARIHASQGQHRAFALALKIAELQLAETVLGGPPVLLLDDVSSELDRERNAQLMRFLDHAGGQVFITTTDRAWIRVEGASRVFRVAGGAIEVVDEATA